jgi:uncharacterized membrane protein
MQKFVRGAVAGAAGTTALNAVGYADMALRGRPASSVPAWVAEQLTRRVGETILGNGEERQNRLEGLGALAGIATGAGVGALAGQLQGATPATPAFEVLQRAAVLGAATGMRSTVALAALVLRRSDGLPAVFRNPTARRIAALADGAELVADKLPMTPSRLDPPGLAGRLISAGLAAMVLARSAHRTPIPAVLTASAAALAAARVCHDARAALARRVPDPAVGLVEDVLAIGLAAVGSG